MLRISLLFVFIAVYAEASTARDGPMVAFMCNKPAMYFSDETGEWMEDHTTDCITDPVKILDYCRAKFPERQVTNVVQGSEKVTINNWCGFDKSKCHKHNTHQGTPYRCLVGAFQSDALLVPEHCLFDHKHGEECTEYEKWNITGVNACEERDMKLESFAILQPCGISKFDGVEFVCCPKISPVQTDAPVSTTTNTPSTSTTQVPFSSSTPELVKIPDEKDADDTEDEDFFAHYLQKSYDERYMNEHNYFIKAKTDLQKHHHERVTKMMKEWAAARQRVQDMNDVDPKGGEKLNREITARFQKTYEALEEEGMAEKKQLQALHQQRVQSSLNDKKRHAMEHYMDALTTQDADAAYILKALEHYIKAEQKDRLHTVNHYKHEIDMDPKEALSLRSQTLNHLRIIDQRVQQAIDMLNRVPLLEKKIRTQIDAYLKTFHEIDVAISEVLVDEVIAAETQTEKSPVVAVEPAVTATPVPANFGPMDTADGDYEEYYDEDDEYDEESDEDYDEDDEDEEEEESDEEEAEIAPTQLKPTEWDEEIDEDEHDLAVPEVMPAHIGVDKLHVNVHEKKSVDNGAAGSKASNALHLYQGYTLGIAVASIAVFVILVVGIVLLRRKNTRVPAAGNHGFVEIDQAAASPEERHVANMQMNGYENPTYKYFESNA